MKTISCKECSKSFMVAPWQIARNSRFCSRACKNSSKEVADKIGNSNKVSLKRFYENGGISANYKGDNAGYAAKHLRIASKLGKPSLCVHCKTTEAKRYEWANVSKEYKDDANDWLRLCSKCHKKYDDVGRKVWITRKLNQQMYAS